MQLTDSEMRVLEKVWNKGSIYDDEVEPSELADLRMLWVKGRVHWDGSAYRVKGES